MDEKTLQAIEEHAQNAQSTPGDDRALLQLKLDCVSLIAEVRRLQPPPAKVFDPMLNPFKMKWYTHPETGRLMGVADDGIHYSLC